MYTQELNEWQHDHVFSQDQRRAGERRTLRSYYEIPEIVKLCVPPQQSWGVSIFY